MAITVKYSVSDLKSFANQVSSDFERAYQNLGSSPNPEAVRIFTETALYRIIGTFGTDSYNFNYCIDLFVVQTSSMTEKALKEILDLNISERCSNCFSSKDMDILFSAYYALSLIYKKSKNKDGLKVLLEDRYRIFDGYLLYPEVLARCHKHLDNLEDALNYDKEAIFVLQANGIYNFGVLISYASTATMLLSSHREISDIEIKRSYVYLDSAIHLNPGYPKYYFIMAQLLYFENVYKKLEFPVFRDICQKVLDLVGKANWALLTLYDETNDLMINERNKYNDFSEAVHRELNARAQAFECTKPQILNSKKYKDSPRPELPLLRPDDPYFFVCYSSRDYKSVYCDLVEMYNRRIPFRYDARLRPGEDWDQQVEEQIMDPNCRGVVFYISKNTLVSPSLCKEIDQVCNRLKKRYFAVNLEGLVEPSQIAIGTVQDEQNSGLHRMISQNLRIFLNAFYDNQVYSAKHPENGEDGVAHFPNLMKALNDTFHFSLPVPEE